MSPGVLNIDLAEARKPLPNLPRWQDAKCPITPDILVKGNLGAGQQADCHIWFPDRSEATGDGIVEPRAFLAHVDT
jgi:hypothetical protein